MQGVQALQPALVMLFGSVAQGEFTQYSDADILTVFYEPVDWGEVYTYSDGWVQPVVKTVQEIQEQLDQGNPLFCELFEDGIVLYDGGVQQHFERLVGETRARFELTRMRHGWFWKNGNRSGAGHFFGE